MVDGKKIYGWLFRNKNPRNISTLQTVCHVALFSRLALFFFSNFRLCFCTAIFWTFRWTFSVSVCTVLKQFVLSLSNSRTCMTYWFFIFSLRSRRRINLSSAFVIYWLPCHHNVSLLFQTLNSRMKAILFEKVLMYHYSGFLLLL